ncbi:Cyclophilin type peptidyl-prolyl cis-trans isomerase/CLD [Babesia microti strain RI]|uniref:Peptidyl-prolyl cis-trans isomerase n=1 Tax=Babesia microti (strain RI) TaxID=1133968 RepID=A0A0K3AMC9_BABMR|nr:Cyclophilin type peptidyl-prolyl cis-trans isomerase/CLD [Babesia microti strain RI]CTQ40889.1 Cyclophilin type peptidyl-prolyl cis-trans isomerase/CLD [Babesia microti strain RI]|eukprot:XP_012648900.1 Cyclophilin type peptidyl-prolyl cis-trans isomerase/CLD [Babesia microti strain RI]
MTIPNPRVFMDISIGGRDIGRMVFELFSDQLPYTCENFRCLCTGETGLGYYLRPRWYKNVPIHRIIPDFMCQGGNFNTGNCFGGESIYGQYLRDESFRYKHSKRGVLSMAKTRVRHSNSSQFFITFRPCAWLDGKHVVFGNLEHGQDVLSQIEQEGTEIGRVKKPVKIWNCGEIDPQCIYAEMPEILPDKPIYVIPKVDKPILDMEIAKSEDSYKEIVPDEVFKRAYYNF